MPGGKRGEQSMNEPAPENQAAARAGRREQRGHRRALRAKFVEPERGEVCFSGGMNDRSKPAKHIGRLHQRADQDDRDDDVSLVGGEAQNEPPFRPEAGKGRKARDRAKQDARTGRFRRAAAPARTSPAGARPPIRSREPEQPGLGEQMIDEQAADHERRSRLRRSSLLQQRKRRASGAPICPIDE